MNLLRSERLTLRPMTEADRGIFIRVHECGWSEHLAPWSPLLDTNPPDFDALFAQQLARSVDGVAAGNSCRLLAFDGDGVLVGAFNLNNVTRGVFQNADAGWWVGVDHVRRG